MRNFFRFHLDSVGFWTSLVCAAHCVAVPFMLTFFSWSYLTLLNNPLLEQLVIAVSLLIAIISLWPGYHLHRRLLPVTLLTAGFTLIGLSRIIPDRWWEMGLTSAGAMLVAGAHVANWKFSRPVKSQRSHL